MRIQHAVQCAGGWPANPVNDCRNRAKFTDAVEHIRWRLWHGQARQHPAHIGPLKAKAQDKTVAARSAAKLARALTALETHVSGLALRAPLGNENFSKHTASLEGFRQCGRI